MSANLWNDAWPERSLDLIHGAALRGTLPQVFEAMNTAGLTPADLDPVQVHLSGKKLVAYAQLGRDTLTGHTVIVTLTEEYVPVAHGMQRVLRLRTGPVGAFQQNGGSNDPCTPHSAEQTLDQLMAALGIIEKLTG